MNRFTPLLVLALCLPLTARADDASHRAKAEELMTILQTQHSIQQIADNIMKQVSQIGTQTIGPNPSDEKKTQLEAFKKQASDAIESQVGWKAMQSGMVDVYTNNLSEEELDAIIAFYKSPAGAAMLAKMPVVNSQVGQLGQSRIAVLQPQLVKLLDDFKKSVAAAAPAPAKPSTGATPSAPAKSTPK